MKRAPTALSAIGGFGVAVAALSVAVTAGVVVLGPEPAPPQMTPNEAVAALRGAETALERRIGNMPEGTRSSVVEGAIAAELGRPVSEVRVVWPQGSYTSQSSQIIRSMGQLQADQGGEPVTRSTFVIRRPDGEVERVDSDVAGEFFRSAMLGLRVPAFAAGVRQSDGRWLIVATPTPFLTGWQRNVLIALAVSLLLLAPFAWLFARRLTRPFRALANALDTNAGPIPQEGPRELREAAGAIATMRARLTSEAAERARILTAIAHDLRTPLTGLRLRVETVAEPQRCRMVEDIERMQVMISEVLGFAQDAAVPRERLDVRPFVERILHDSEAVAGNFTLLPGDDATIDAPPIAFRRIVENLICNARDYAGGGRIAVRREGVNMVLSVSDDGPGIAVEDRERLLRPFERGEASRNRDTGGAGLGLSIVREFAARQRGSFSLEVAPEGGTMAVIRLPMVDHPH